MGSDLEKLIDAFNACLGKTENRTYYGNTVITYISINNHIQFLTNANHKILVYICYKMFKEWTTFHINK